MLYTLAKSQACPLGNKRIAVVLVETFLALNGFTLDASESELENQVLCAATSEKEARPQVLRELTEWLQQNVVETED